MKKLKTIIGFGMLSLGMTAYTSLMGFSSNSGSATALYDFSKDALANWHQVATTLSVPLASTKPGMLSPVIPDRFNALDLIIYGHELVSAEYQDTYRQLNLPRMVGKLHISTNENKQLQYFVAGMQVLSMRDMDGKQGSIFYMDVPFHVIDQANRQYDNTPAIGDSDDSGKVRYSRMDDGRYVMGLFLSYQD